ncbi:MAG: NADH-quinone oxidoreductase subunit L, partial [Spirochaetia bacterium]
WQSGSTGRVFWALGLLGAFITSLYIFRLIFLVFFGQARGATAEHGHAAGRNGRQAGGVMGVPLAILAVLCLVGGFLALPRLLGGRPFILDFLHTILPAETAPEPSAATELTLQIIAVAVSLLGIPAAWVLSKFSLKHEAHPAVLVRFLQSGWGFDWIYDRVLVRPFVWIARINSKDIVDKLAVGIGGLNMLLSRGLRLTQSGRVRWYAAGVAAGAVLIVAAVVLL